MTRDLQFNGLQHIISQQSFHQPTLEYALKKRSKTKITSPYNQRAADAVYLGLIPYDRFTKPVNQGSVTLIFSEELMARNDYHVNIGWNYGRKTEESASPERYWKMLLTMQKIIKLSSPKDIVPRNEVVFQNDVSFDDLKAIYVHASDYEQTVKTLMENPDIKIRNLIKLLHVISI